MFQIRQNQRRHGEFTLASHMQHLATRRHYLELWAGSQQLCYLYPCSYHLLKVIQQQQRLLLEQLLPQAFKPGQAGCLPDVERLGDGGYDERGVADGSQVHEEHSIGKAIAQLGCHLQAQARLACAARTCQGEQAHILAAQQTLDGAQFLLAPDEWCELGGQVVGIDLERSRAREVGREIRDHQLEEASGASQILEAVFSQVAQAHLFRQVLLHEGSGCLGEQHLPPVRRAHDARGAVDIQADVAFGCPRRLAGMNAHAHTHGSTFRPGMIGKRALGV